MSEPNDMDIRMRNGFRPIFRVEPAELIRDKDGARYTITTIMDKLALEQAAAANGMARAGLIELGWTPPESAALHSAEREVLEAALRWQRSKGGASDADLTALDSDLDISVRRYRALLDGTEAK